MNSYQVIENATEKIKLTNKFWWPKKNKDGNEAIQRGPKIFNFIDCTFTFQLEQLTGNSLLGHHHYQSILITIEMIRALLPWRIWFLVIFLFTFMFSSFYAFLLLMQPTRNFQWTLQIITLKWKKVKKSNQTISPDERKRNLKKEMEKRKK